MSSLVLDTPLEHVARITFNRPQTQNAFTFDMYRTFLQMLRDLQYDSEVRVVVLTGSGAGFCSGHDLRSSTPAPWAPGHASKLHRDLYGMQEIREIPILMRGMPQPVLAAVNGSVAGIGAVFVLAADVAVAARSAKFVNAFHHTGAGSEGGVSYLLPRAVGTQRAAEIMLTDRTVTAEEAARIGLVLKAVPDDALMSETLDLAEAMMSNTPLDNWLTKQALYANQSAPSYANAIDLDTRGVIMARTTLDVQERQAARAERRPPRYSYE